METEVKQQWKGLSPTAFDKYVEKLSSSEYQRMCATDPEFFEAVNTTRDKRKVWGKDPNYTISKDSELGKFVAAEEEARLAPAKAELKRLESEHIALAKQVRKELKAMIENGAGLTPAQAEFWIDPKLQFIRITGKLSPDSIAALRKAQGDYEAEIGLKLSTESRDLLLDLMAKLTFDQTVADFRTLLAWQTAGKIAEAIGKKLTAAPATPDKPRVNLERAEPTAAEKRRAFFNDAVLKWRGKDYTAAAIEKLGSEEYRQLCNENPEYQGKVLMHTSELRPGRGN